MMGATIYPSCLLSPMPDMVGGFVVLGLIAPRGLEPSPLHESGCMKLPAYTSHPSILRRSLPKDGCFD